jgi:hypothetical protein
MLCEKALEAHVDKQFHPLKALKQLKYVYDSTIPSSPISKKPENFEKL